MITFYDFDVPSGGYTPYPHQSVTATEASNTNSSVWTTQHTHTFTGLAIGVDYAVFFSIEGGNPGNASVSQDVRLRLDGATDLKTWLLRNNTTTGYLSQGGVHVFTATATSHTLALEFKSQSTAQVKAKNGRIALLPLDATNDFYMNGAGTGSGSSTTFVNAGTLSFTPPTSGDYVLIATTQLAINSEELILEKGGVTTPAFRYGHGAGTGSNFPLATIVWKLTGLSGSQIVNLQVRRDSVIAYNTEDVTILALRLDRFAQVAEVESGAVESGTDTSYTDSLTQTFTANNADYLTLATTGFRNSSATESSGLRLDDGSGVVGEAIYYPFQTTQYHGVTISAVSHLSQGSVTQRLQRDAQATNTAYLAEGAAIVALDLTGIA